MIFKKKVFKRFSISIFLFFLVSLNSFIFSIYAIEEPNGLLINDDLKQCAYEYIGEKCTSCEFPPGWETTKRYKCPKEYTSTRVKTVCKPVKSPYCCTVDYEGNGGNCSDVVVNLIEKNVHLFVIFLIVNLYQIIGMKLMKI